MKVKLLNGTENPEQLVCTAARNDYRSDGVIGYPIPRIMSDIDPDPEHLESLKMDGNVSPRMATEAKKRTLIDKLMRSGHWGPFEHPQAVVAIEGISRVVTHQIVRHRHFSFDQQSMRFVGVGDIDPSHIKENMDEYFDIPDIRGEDFDVDREGVHDIENPDLVENIYDDAYRSAVYAYQDLRNQGVPRRKRGRCFLSGSKPTSS